MNKENIYFKLYACCVIDKGPHSNIITDLQRATYIEIDSLVYELLVLLKDKSIEQVKQFYNHEHDDGIDRYIDYFVSEEYGFITKEPQSFPEIDFTWKSPHKVVDAILEFEEGQKDYDIIDAIEQLSTLGCKNLQLRFLGKIKETSVLSILSTVQATRIVGLEIYYNFNFFDEKLWIDHIRSYKKIAKIYVTDAPKQESKTFNERALDDRISYLTSKIDQLNDIKFSKNIQLLIAVDFYAEAQKHNLGLNRKVCIDKYGNFKNHLSHSSIFGNINSRKITDLITDPEFLKHWFYANDQIEQCNSCQFKHLCMSTSEVTVKGEKLYKKTYCNFNPYNNKWVNET